MLHQLYSFLPADQDLESLKTPWIKDVTLLESHIEQAIRDLIPLLEQTFIVIDGLDEFQRVSDAEFVALCQFIRSLNQLPELLPKVRGF